MLFAHRDPLLSGTVLADDVTTPVEAAVTAVGSALLDDVVSATAAEGATAVEASASAVTLSSGCAREVHAGVPLAEVGRTLVVEEVQCQVSGTAKPSSSPRPGPWSRTGSPSAESFQKKGGAIP